VMIFNLLATGLGEKFLKLGETLSAFFKAFGVLEGVQVLLLFMLFYFVSKTLRDNDATKLMVVYWGLLVIMGLMSYVTEFLNAEFYLYFVMLLSLFILILFNVEVKKSIWDVYAPSENTETTRIGGGNTVTSKETVENNIADIIRALQNMSKNNVGALIVLSKGNLPKQVLQSGVYIDSDISTQMIEGIFFPNAPLHDGAMIIRGHKIQAAGCFLPLTQKTSYPKEFGTRHRAGIGITEVANVIAVVVSEETGIISIIKQGNVQRYADYDMLSSALRDYYWQELPLSDKKRKDGNAR
ncbi:MAG: DNA integrity scanning protein DisA nucleotide-binding domain protein, partial [Clostridia bacterium]|nr:DNA integrity scanning protein DisA nucleotide-binding domain protein [Clostridia bacterium]